MLQGSKSNTFLFLVDDKNDRSSDLSFFVINNNMEYNYVEVNKAFMPTQGIGYHPAAKIETRLLSIGDVKLLSMMTEDNMRGIYKEIIKRCCRFTNMTIDDLYLADRDFLLFWIRSGSFVSNSGYSLKMDACPHCGKRSDVQVKLDDFELDFASAMTDSIVVNGELVTFHHPKINDQRIALNDLELSDVLTYTNLLEIFGDVRSCAQFLLSLDARSYLKLLHKTRKFRCGIRDELNLTCPICRNVFTTRMRLAEHDLMAQIPIDHILKLILGICKYSNFQITDDMLYAEVELMRNIVEEMSREEQKELDKANGIETLSNFR